MTNREITVDVLQNEMIEGTTKGYLTKTYTDEMDVIAPDGWALHFIEQVNGTYGLHIYLKDVEKEQKVRGMVIRLNNVIGVVNVMKFYPVEPFLMGG